MFDSFSELFTSFSDSFVKKTEEFTESVDAIKQDVDEVRGFLGAIIQVITSVFDFLGRETSVLILATLLFLLIINFIPFFFFDKKIKYYVGVAFGLFIGITYNFSIVGMGKYVLVMFLPLIVEGFIVFVFGKTKNLLWSVLKKTFEVVKVLLKQIFGIFWSKKKPADPPSTEK